MRGPCSSQGWGLQFPNRGGPAVLIYANINRNILYHQEFGVTIDSSAQCLTELTANRMSKVTQLVDSQTDGHL